MILKICRYLHEHIENECVEENINKLKSWKSKDI